MPTVETKYFGTMEYREESVYEFPHGLPAFENERQFVLIEQPESKPLVFLQSLARSSLCFLAFPMWAVDPNYQLGISHEGLGLDTERQPAQGSDVLVLALVALRAKFSATANLMAPVVVNLNTRQALQAIRSDSLYSCEHVLERATAEGMC